MKTHSEVRCCTRRNDGHAWAIAKQFLVEGCSFEELPQPDWTEVSTDHDKFIPHPPDKENLGNIAQLVDKMRQAQNGGAE